MKQPLRSMYPDKPKEKKQQLSQSVVIVAKPELLPSNVSDGTIGYTSEGFWGKVTNGWSRLGGGNLIELADSVENLPDSPDGTLGYTPDGLYIRHGGVWKRITLDGENTILDVSTPTAFDALVPANYPVGKIARLTYQYLNWLYMNTGSTFSSISQQIVSSKTQVTGSALKAGAFYLGTYQMEIYNGITWYPVAGTPYWASYE